jgi:hypothetical protein
MTHLSASQLKTTLSNPTRTALRALGYKDQIPNFKFAKGHCVEEYVFRQSQGEDVPIELIYNAKAWGQLKSICDGMDLQALERQFDTTECVSGLVGNLISTAYGFEIADKLHDQYIDQYTEIGKYSSIDISINDNYKYQVRFESKLFGLSLPFVGFADYVGNHDGVDLKTVDKIPDAIPLGDKIQIYIYELAFNKPFELVYVSPPSTAELDKYNKNEAIHNLHKIGVQANDIAKTLGTTMAYITKVLNAGIGVKPELQYKYASLTDDDKSMLVWFVPKLAHKTLRIISSREYIEDLLLTDLSGWNLTDSEKQFIMDELKKG